MSEACPASSRRAGIQRVIYQAIAPHNWKTADVVPHPDLALIGKVRGDAQSVSMVVFIRREVFGQRNGSKVEAAAPDLWAVATETTGLRF